MPDDKTTQNGDKAAAAAPAEVEVYAVKGPLAGRRIVVPADQVDAATADNGWAVKIEPGAQLLPDPGAPYDTSWVIPGFTSADLEPFAKTAEDKGVGGKVEDTKAAASAGSSSAKPTSSSQPAAKSATEQDAASQNGGASASEGDPAPAAKTTTTKTSTK